MKNYYEILELNEDASKEQIKEAYRRLARLHHPDKNINNNKQDQELFKDINEAKQILFNDEKKAEYDVLLSNYILANHKDNLNRKRPLSGNLKIEKTSLLKFSLFAGLAILAITLILKFANNSTEVPKEPIAKVSSKPKLVTQEKKPEIVSSGAESTPSLQEKKEVIVIPKTKKPVFKLAKIATPPIAKKSTTTKVLSNQQMSKILNAINLKKARSKNFSNCVQIRKTYNSNIVNAFEIANFLSKKGFVIAGREVIKTSDSGIQINAKESCIKITFGTM